MPGATRGDPPRGRPIGGRDRELGAGSRIASSIGFPRPSAEDLDRRRAASTSTRSSPRPAAEARAELGWEGRGARLPLRRVADRAQERRQARGRVRARRRRQATRSSATACCARRWRDGENVRVIGRIRSPRSRAGSPPATSSASPRFASRSARRRSRGWRWSGSSSRRRSEARPSSSAPEAGVLVDPGDLEALTDALRRPPPFRSPNPAARGAAAEHDVRREAERMTAVLEKAASGTPGS